MLVTIRLEDSHIPRLIELLEEGPDEDATNAARAALAPYASPFPTDLASGAVIDMLEENGYGAWASTLVLRPDSTWTSTSALGSANPISMEQVKEYWAAGRCRLIRTGRSRFPRAGSAV